MSNSIGESPPRALIGWYSTQLLVDTSLSWRHRERIQLRLCTFARLIVNESHYEKMSRRYWRRRRRCFCLLVGSICLCEYKLKYNVLNTSFYTHRNTHLYWIQEWSFLYDIIRHFHVSLCDIFQHAFCISLEEQDVWRNHPKYFRDHVRFQTFYLQTPVPRLRFDESSILHTTLYWRRTKYCLCFILACQTANDARRLMSWNIYRSCNEISKPQTISVVERNRHSGISYRIDFDIIETFFCNGTYINGLNVSLRFRLCQTSCSWCEEAELWYLQRVGMCSTKSQ